MTNVSARPRPLRPFLCSGLSLLLVAAATNAQAETGSLPPVDDAPPPAETPTSPKESAPPETARPETPPSESTPPALEDGSKAPTSTAPQPAPRPAPAPQPAPVPESAPAQSSPQLAPRPKSPAAKTPATAPAAAGPTSPAAAPATPGTANAPYVPIADSSAASDAAPDPSGGAGVEPEEDSDFDGGLYLTLGGAATFTPESTHQWADGNSCPQVSTPEWNPSCSAKTPMGAAVEARLGIRINFFALEGFALGAMDWSSAELGGEEPPFELPDYASNMSIGRVGGGLGGGIRLSTPGSSVRLSVGAGAGVMFRHVYSNVSSLDGSSLGYTAPIGRADLTLTIFNSFKLGILGWVEKSKKVAVTPKISLPGVPTDLPGAQQAQLDQFQDALGDVTVFDGTQYFIGPYLGLHFGN